MDYGRRHVAVQLGGVCTINSCFFVSFSVRGHAHVHFSVSRVQIGLTSGGISGTAGTRIVRLRPRVVLRRNGSFLRNCHGVIIVQGVAFPGSGILAVRLDRGRVSKHGVSLGVSCRSILGTSGFGRILLGRR